MEGPVSRDTPDGLEAGVAGRGQAFARLVDRRSLDRAYRSATLLLGDPQDAEDAVHDAALTAWRRFGDLRDPARFEAWFGRILVNACRDRLRARRRAPVFLDMAPEPVATGDREAVVDRRLALAAALRRLSAEHREVLVLRFFEDLTIEDIAERTGARPGTVKSRLHYALRELRSAYGPEDGGGRPGPRPEDGPPTSSTRPAGERRAVR